MYIENLKNKKRLGDVEEKNMPQKNEQLLLEEPEEMEEIEAPHEGLLEEFSHDVLAHWRALEFEPIETSGRWALYAGLVLALIIAFAIYADSPIMAITFILIGLLGYMYMHKEPRELDFLITYDGVMAGREIFRFENAHSFWIFYDEHLQVLSLHTKGNLTQYVHFPLADQDPVEIRETMLKFLPEEKQEFTLMDSLERFLKF